MERTVGNLWEKFQLLLHKSIIYLTIDLEDLIKRRESKRRNVNKILVQKEVIQHSGDGKFNIMHAAASYNCINILKALIWNGCNVNDIDGEGWNVLHFASFNQSVDVIRYVCTSHRQLMDVKNNDGLTSY